jgi:GT2 family glycosyltransferase
LQRDAGHKVLVVIPVHGHHEMTHALLGDLAREAALVDVVIVDNRGDYPRIGDEDVVVAPHNLGWAEGTNHGTRARVGAGHDAYLWLNNDTRLSEGFVAGLLHCAAETGAGVIGPVYDCHWVHQRARRPVPVERYRPRAVHARASFIDGTAMFVPASTVATIGLLDADTFAPIGWGAEIDYCLRAGNAGLAVVVTRLSYLHHEKSVTGRTAFDGGLTEYAERGFPVAMRGLETKWGAEWRRLAGIDPSTQQTSTPGRRSRVRAGRARPATDASASRSPSSRSR